MNNNYSAKEIRSSAILTNSYVEATILWQTDFNQVQELNQLVLYISFTKWSLTSMELKIEFSDDWVTYYQETFSSISWGLATESLAEHEFTDTWNYTVPAPFKSKFVKVSVKWTWTVTNSLCAIKWVLWIA